MNVYSAVLFVHLVGAVALFIGQGIEWTASSLFRNASSTEQLRSWLRVFKVSPPLSGAGVGILLLSGGFLASRSGAMKQGWIPTALIGIFIALAIGFTLILPRMKRIQVSLPPGNEPLSTSLRVLSNDPALLTAIRVRVMLATAILYLMAAKIPLTPSLVVLAIGIVLGLIFSIPVWSRTAAAPAKV